MPVRYRQVELKTLLAVGWPLLPARPVEVEFDQPRDGTLAARELAVGYKYGQITVVDEELPHNLGELVEPGRLAVAPAAFDWLRESAAAATESLAELVEWVPRGLATPLAAQHEPARQDLARDERPNEL